MSKYNNRKVEKDGFKFDSIKEYEYYLELKQKLHDKKIINFKVHPKIILQPEFISNSKKIKPITYTPDYVVYHDGKTEIIDIKGGKATQTREWKNKWKMLQYQYRNEKNYLFTIV